MANIERKKVDTSALKGKPIIWIMGNILTYIYITNKHIKTKYNCTILICKDFTSNKQIKITHMYANIIFIHKLYIFIILSHLFLFKCLKSTNISMMYFLHKIYSFVS